METLELEYIHGVEEFVCPLAETTNCQGKNGGTYKTRKGLVDHIHLKHCPQVLWICCKCTYKGKGRYSFRQVKQHYYVSHANPDTVQPSGSSKFRIIENKLVKEYKNQHIEH